MQKLFLPFFLAVFCTACAIQKPQQIYYWGSYEQQIYAMYSAPGKSSPEQQLEKLEADYQKARAANKPVPPGYNAQVGFLYFQLGKTDQALKSFETEVALFPESKIYMDRLIERLKRN